MSYCQCCYDELNKDNSAKYTDKKGGDKMDSIFCRECIEIVLDTQWNTYVNLIKKADCAAALKRAIDIGPPTNLRDPKAFPCDNKSKEVYTFYYGKRKKSAKLKGSLEGEERMKWWNEYLSIQKAMEQAEKADKAKINE